MGMTKSRRLAVSTPAAKPPLRRLFWALGRLPGGKALKATDLAREFEVNVRTAYRDLDFLRDDWRVPLEYDRPQGTYRLTEPIGSPPPARHPQPGRAARHLLRREGRAPVPRHAVRSGPDQRVREDAGAAAGRGPG